MRLLSLVLVALGITGIVFGVLTLMHGAQGLNGTPFSYENYGGPGSIIAGAMMIAGGLYFGTLKVRQG